MTCIEFKPYDINNYKRLQYLHKKNKNIKADLAEIILNKHYK